MLVRNLPKSRMFQFQVASDSVKQIRQDEILRHTSNYKSHNATYSMNFYVTVFRLLYARKHDVGK